MHSVLAQPCDDPDFAPEPPDESVLQAWTIQAQHQVEDALELLAGIGGDEQRVEHVHSLARRRADILHYLERQIGEGRTTLRTRIHGDLHLGQVLVAGGDVVIIDFEGEPTKPLSERRAKLSPMRDIAGMIRSFDYAASVAERERNLASGSPGAQHATELLTDFRRVAETSFLDGYVEGRGHPLTPAERGLIDAFAIEKAAYEICYEVTNRPDWIDVPLSGLISHLAAIPAQSSEPAYG